MNSYGRVKRDQTYKMLLPTGLLTSLYFQLCEFTKGDLILLILYLDYLGCKPLGFYMCSVTCTLETPLDTLDVHVHIHVWVCVYIKLPWEKQWLHFSWDETSRILQSQWGGIAQSNIKLVLAQTVRIFLSLKTNKQRIFTFESPFSFMKYQ